MNTFIDFIKHLFDADGWPARWVCGKWTPFHGWLYIISSVAIGLAYFSIPFTLYGFLKKKNYKVPFVRIFWLFILFIFACGLTHFADAIMFWYPAYRVSATVLFITAVVSWMAVIALFKVLPHALQLKSPTQLELIIEERTAELEKSNLHLQALNTQLQNAQREMELLMNQKDEFISIASHELKTPMTGMQLAIQMADNELTDDHVLKSYLNKASRQLKKLTALTEDLFNVTKIQNGQLVYEFKKESLEPIVRNAADIFSEADRSRIQLTADHNLTVNADAARLEQAIQNILSNALKYSYPNTPVQVIIKKEGDDAAVVIKDEGVGIANEKLPFIFDRFYRGHNSHDYQGIGLGLYIASQIIQAHRGRIEVESKTNIGSIFKIVMPAV